jgi:hypothetical protein
MTERLQSPSGSGRAMIPFRVWRGDQDCVDWVALGNATGSIRRYRPADASQAASWARELKPSLLRTLRT